MKINLNFEKFIKDSKSIKLKKEEKAESLNYLINIMSANPVRDGRLAGHRLWSNSFSQFKLTFIKPMPIIIILAILVSGGTAFSANGTMPGDSLYPFKLVVNENVRGWVAFSDEARTSWEAHLSKLRLEEAEKLAVENKLDSEIEVSLEENFKKHSGNVRLGLQEIKSKDASKAFEINSDFQTSLKTHSGIIDDIAASANDKTAVQLNKLSIVVKGEVSDTNKDESDYEIIIKLYEDADVRAAAEAKMSSAYNSIIEIQNFINAQDNLDADTKVKLDIRINSAESIFTEGKIKFEAKLYSEAFILFQDSQNIAVQTKLLLKTKIELESVSKDNNQESSPTPSPSPGSKQSESPEQKIGPTPEPTISGKAGVELETEIEINNTNVNVNANGKVNIDLGL